MTWQRAIKSALRPGADLSHRAGRTAPVDGLQLLGRIAATYPEGAALLKIRLGIIHGPELLGVVRVYVRVCARADGWTFAATRSRIAPRVLSRRFAAQVASEFLGDQCARCAGRGTVGRSVGGRRVEDHHGAVRACSECDGTGLERDRARARARALGLSHASILRTWAPRFDGTLARMAMAVHAAEAAAARLVR